VELKTVKRGQAGGVGVRRKAGRTHRDGVQYSVAGYVEKGELEVYYEK
jgi:hypothetical protein